MYIHQQSVTTKGWRDFRKIEGAVPIYNFNEDNNKNAEKGGTAEIVKASISNESEN